LVESLNDCVEWCVAGRECTRRVVSAECLRREDMLALCLRKLTCEQFVKHHWPGHVSAPDAPAPDSAPDAPAPDSAPDAEGPYCAAEEFAARASAGGCKKAERDAWMQCYQ
jgi:hypothetical protein